MFEYKHLDNITNLIEINKKNDIDIRRYRKKQEELSYQWCEKYNILILSYIKNKVIF